MVNVLITSEVLEEGVDIQTCNYVIRYDSPKNFPSYVQSKGRARSNRSKFIVMVPNKLKFEKVQTEYVKMEEEIDKVCLDNRYCLNHYSRDKLYFLLVVFFRYWFKMKLMMIIMRKILLKFLEPKVQH